jgi:D-alanyl-D-alanine carboxypeptidase (penicillin-binding protein 5/6)
MRSRRAFALLTLLLLFAAWALPASAAGSDISFPIELSARAAYVVNRETGKVIYAKNENQRMAPASCTKIMTVGLAMELCEDPDNTVVTVPYGIWNEFEGIDISNAGLGGGEEITMTDLFHCMLIQSANEAASVVANYFGREDFIAKMNAKAKELGCTDTHFMNPHGLDAEGHYTTAKDLYLITRWAMETEGFWEMTCLNRYTLPATNVHSQRDLISTNKMQEPTSGYYTSYIRGIKTGTTDAAGRCLVSAAQKDGYTYVSVLLGCPMETDSRFWEQGSSAYTDARLLYDWCFANLSISRVAYSGTPISEIPLKYAKDKDYLVLYSAGEISTLLDRNNTEKPVIRYETDIPKQVVAPVEEGTVLGTAKVYCDEVYLGTVELVTREKVEKSWFAFFLDRIAALLTSVPAMVIYALLLLMALAYVYYMVFILPARQKDAEERKQRRN